jgi:cobalt-precorrin-5B (C1)-methyltransferase
MRKGFTTGTAATCAAVAHAIYKLSGEKQDFVNVILPDNNILKISVNICNNYAFVIKDSGDDPDVTNGLKICASVKLLENTNKIIIKGGKGIGVVTKPGLQIEIGKSAINPVPLKMIESNLKNISNDKFGMEVTIFVPEGEKIAEKTFNERIGIKGGISIIGTTGIVEPMSIDAIIATIKCEIDILFESKIKEFALVPGKIGEKHLKNIFPDMKSVIVSNYFKETFDYLLLKNIKRMTIAGHPGKLAKLAMGYYNTHSKKSPMATNFVAEKLDLNGNFNTVEEICSIVNENAFDKIAKLISKKVIHDFDFKKVSVLLFNMKGDLKGKWI